MVKVNWTRQSIEDIHAIREYYIIRSVKYTDELKDKIFEKAEKLSMFPKMGRMVPEIENKNIRELIYQKYRMI
jgi:plasmid stabilization system protein ParE